MMSETSSQEEATLEADLPPCGSSGVPTSDLPTDTQKSFEEDKIPKQSASSHDGDHARKSSETETTDLSTDSDNLKALEKLKTPEESATFLDNEETVKSNNIKDVAINQLDDPLNKDLFSKHSLNNNEKDNALIEDFTSSSDVESLVIDLPNASDTTITSQDNHSNVDQLFSDAHNKLLDKHNKSATCADDDTMSVLGFDKENRPSCSTPHDDVIDDDINLKVGSDFSKNSASIVIDYVTSQYDSTTGISESFDPNLEKVNEPPNNQISKNTSLSSSEINDHSDVDDMDDSNLLHIDLSSKEDEIDCEENENNTSKDIQEPSNTKVSEEKEDSSDLITGSELTEELESEKNISEADLPNTLKEKTAPMSTFCKTNDIPVAEIDSSDTELIESADSNTIIPSAPNLIDSNEFQPLILNVVGNCDIINGQIELPSNKDLAEVGKTTQSVTQHVLEKINSEGSQVIELTSETIENSTSTSSTSHAPKTILTMSNTVTSQKLPLVRQQLKTNPSAKTPIVIAPKPPISMYYQNGLINKVQSKEASSSPPVIATGIASSSRPTLIIQAGAKNVSSIRLNQLQTQTKSLINIVQNKGQLSLLSSSSPQIQTSQVQNGTIMKQKGTTIKENGQTYSVTFSKENNTIQYRILKPKEDQISMVSQDLNKNSKKKTEPILGGNLRDKLKQITEEVKASSALDREDLIKSDFFCTDIFNNARHTNQDNCLYECSACKDKFNHLAGLEYHLFRCVFMLEYDCSVCCKKLTFFNKCRFWRHLVGETGDPLKAKKRFITEKTSILMFPLPSKHIAISVQETHLNKLLNGELNEKVCPCCLESFVSKAQFQLHLQKGNGKNSFQCPHCKLVMKSKCAATAHKNIHGFSQSQTPEPAFWCPECGDHLELTSNDGNKLGLIFEHLDKCFHFNRSHAFKCLDPTCSETFISEGTFKSHLLSKHMYVLFKCKVCSTAYKDDFTQLIKHYLTQHKVDMSKSSFQPIKFCILCKVVSRSVEDLMQHLNKHFVEMAKKWLPKYKCFACLQCFTDQSTFNHHVETFHTPKPKRCTKCLSLFSTRKLLVDHIVQKRCNMSLSSKLDVCVDIKEPDSYHDVLTKVKALFTPRVLPVSNSRVVFTNNRIQPSSGGAPGGIGLNRDGFRIGSPNISVQNKRSLLVNIGNQSNIRFSSRPAVPVSIAPAAAPPQTQSLIRPIVASTIQMPPSTESRSLLQAQLFSTDRNSPDGTPNRRKRKADSINSDDSDSLDKEPFQCHSCKIVIQGSRNWFEHTNEHYLEGRTIIREKTRCIVCNKYVVTDILEKHIKEHQNKGIKVCKNCQCRSFETIRQVREHEKALCRYKVVKGNGCPFPTDTDEESEDVDTEDVNDELVEESERRESTENNGSDNQDTSDRESPLLESVLIPCLLCGMTFSSKEAQQDHVSRMHDGTRTVFSCLLCYKRTKEKKVFKKRQLLVRHIELKHKLTSESEIVKLIKEEEQNITSGLEVTGTAPGQEQDDRAPPKRLRIEAQGDFLCGKCAFSCTEQEEFSKHIASHNSKKDPQCPECGLCFSVSSALKRHLFAVHKIKAIDNYLKEKGLLESESSDDDDLPCRVVPVFPPSPEVGAGRRGGAKAAVGRKRKRDKSPEFVDPGECNVCYRVFDDEATLKTHMRNHGMAFIRSKRYKTNTDITNRSWLL